MLNLRLSIKTNCFMNSLKFRFSTVLLLSLLALVIGVVSCKKDSQIKIQQNHKSGPGESANDLLSASEYERLLVEIQYMDGMRPSPEAVDRLETFLEERLNKPSGVEFVYTQIPSGNKTKYSLDEIKEIENEHRTVFTEDKTIGTYFLFLDGDYIENEGNSVVLGIAYFNTSMVIFEKTIQDLTQDFGSPDTDKLETVVINHEFGHILGLVNLGSPMQTNHQDVEHGKHCDNEDCLMNWQAETGDAISNFLGTSGIPGLDQNCIDDLKANGGK